MAPGAPLPVHIAQTVPGGQGFHDLHLHHATLDHEARGGDGGERFRKPSLALSVKDHSPQEYLQTEHMRGADDASCLWPSFGRLMAYSRSFEKSEYG